MLLNKHSPYPILSGYCLQSLFQASVEECFWLLSTGTSASPPLLDLWARLRHVWTSHDRGFAAFAEQKNTDVLPGVTAIDGLWLSTGTSSDRCFPDFQRACSRGGGYRVSQYPPPPHVQRTLPYLAVVVGKFVKQVVRDRFPSTTGPLLPTTTDSLPAPGWEVPDKRVPHW